MSLLGGGVEEKGGTLSAEGGWVPRKKAGVRGRVEVSALSGLVPLEGEEVRGACACQTQGSENLTYYPCLLTASTPQPRVWEPELPWKWCRLWSCAPGKRWEVGAQAGGGGSISNSLRPHFPPHPHPSI